MRITKAILESVTSQTFSFNNLDQVQVQLKQALAGKKFLIVLDDIWNKKYSDWNVLKKPFNDGAEESKVVVTTRDREAAGMMTTVQLHDVKFLSKEDCWSLFAQHAFANTSIDANPKLVSIGKEIVKKCKGLPLAARTLGGLLRSKVRDEEWEDVLHSKIWDLPQESDILPALRLSYHHLPSHLKQCFAYCSIIPNDYEFEEEELVLLWMAEGFIQKQRKKQMEDVGGEYFRELLSRSFFQPSSTSKSSKFVMHDLINDLAQVVARDTCLRLDDKFKDQEQYRNLNKVRHSSHMQNYYEGKLASLQTLSNFIVTKNNGHQLRELGNLIYLRGKFCLSGLQNVVVPLDAREANLNDKKGLDVLSMEWSVNSNDSRDGRVETEVLDMLRPHKDLKELHIKGYLGIGFPTWIGDPLFSNMVDLSLDNCGNYVDMIVLTDGSHILGLHDLEVQGIGIPIGKLGMYVAAAGINPQRKNLLSGIFLSNEVAVSLDKYLLSSFEDMGLRQPRLEGEEYLSIVDEFMEAIHARWPKAIVQGTAGVALAGLLGTVRAQRQPLTDVVNQKIVVVGAGSAGLGVFNMAAQAVSRMAGAEASPPFFLLDKNVWFYRYYLLSNFFVLNVNYRISLYYVLLGIYLVIKCGEHMFEHIWSHYKERKGVDPAAAPFAKAPGEIEGLGLREGANLVEVVKKVKPHVLLGLSGVGSVFSE
ncbi:hypothetical protein ACSBR1_017525 [Camellia fascicularis]